jgi:predicted P-loop ATPase
VDTLWALEGAQGTRKSASLRALGRQFHAEISAPIGTTDFLREMRGVLIAEMSELDSLRGREASTIKRLLSAPVDRYVEKYEKNPISYPRRAVAVATTNEAQYWQDSTGARRLVPITTGVIEIQMIEDNREQWFAEARDLFKAGATWWEYPVEILNVQEDRQQVDPWEDLLRSLMVNGREVSRGYDAIAQCPLVEIVKWPVGWISSAAIMRDWLKLPPHQQGQTAGVRLGRVMKRLGFEPHKQGKGRERGWRPAGTQGDANG